MVNKNDEGAGDVNANPESGSAAETGSPSESRSRRDVLKTTLSGGTVITTVVAAGAWSKPVIDHVILPAHAQTSAPAAGGGGSNNTPPANTNVTFRFTVSDSSGLA